jgi:hypothetical protein
MERDGRTSFPPNASEAEPGHEIAILLLRLLRLVAAAVARQLQHLGEGQSSENDRSQEESPSAST